MRRRGSSPSAQARPTASATPNACVDDSETPVGSCCSSRSMRWTRPGIEARCGGIHQDDGVAAGPFIDQRQSIAGPLDDRDVGRHAAARAAAPPADRCRRRLDRGCPCRRPARSARVMFDAPPASGSGRNRKCRDRSCEWLARSDPATRRPADRARASPPRKGLPLCSAGFARSAERCGHSRRCRHRRSRNDGRSGRAALRCSRDRCRRAAGTGKLAASGFS